MTLDEATNEKIGPETRAYNIISESNEAAKALK
jgi:hypothetical protein